MSSRGARTFRSVSQNNPPVTLRTTTFHTEIIITVPCHAIRPGPNNTVRRNGRKRTTRRWGWEKQHDKSIWYVFSFCFEPFGAAHNRYKWPLAANMRTIRQAVSRLRVSSSWRRRWTSRIFGRVRAGSSPDERKSRILFPGGGGRGWIKYNKFNCCSAFGAITTDWQRGRFEHGQYCLWKTLSENVPKTR